MTDRHPDPMPQLPDPAPLAHRQRLGAWYARWAQHLTNLVLATALVVVTISFARYASRQDAVVACRAKVAAAVQAAQVDNDVALNDLVAALPDPARRPYSTELSHLTATGRALQAASEQRTAFEAHPTSSC